VNSLQDVYVEEGEEPYMTIQWFYRPDEAKKKRGGLFPIRRKNEVFYRWVVHFYVYLNLTAFWVRSRFPLLKAAL
jgi:hypothetical protein